MKIAFILRSVVLTGGRERVVIDKMNWLAERRHDVLLITYEQGKHPMSFRLHPKINHVDIDCRYFTIYNYSLLLRPFLMVKMKHKFKKELRSLLANYRFDVVVMPHNIVEYQYGIASMSSVISVVYESHRASAEFVRGGLLKMLTNHIYFFPMLKKINMVIALTQGDSKFWERHCNHVQTVANPLSSYPNTIEDCSKEEGRILYVGRLHHVKRIDRLIHAFSMIADKYPLWHIDIFGDGEEKIRLQNMISDFGLTERVIIHKPVSTIFEEYRRSQFLVLSSDSEGFSLVVVEAMACGIPVVSTDCPFGPREMVDDGKTGLLSRLEAEDLAAKMEWMMTHDSERKKMGLQAHQAVSRFEKNKVMEEWEKAYLLAVKSFNLTLHLS